MSRRSALVVLASGLATAVSRSTLAKPAPAIPEVDALTLHIITDNATFGPFLANLDLPGLRVVRTGNGSPTGYTRMSRQALMGEFGLSILAESRLGDQRRNVLVDFGYTPEVLANNLKMLGIQPSAIDAAVLSHGHLDHYGGFPGLFGAEASTQQKIPLFVGGEEAFCERVAMIGNPPPVMGLLDRAALAQAGFDVRINAEPVVVADHAFTSGVIPLDGFERTAIPTEMRPGVGCVTELLARHKQAATQITDDGEHELATCYAVKGLGLVVIASCSHRGVLNSVRRAQALSGISKVHAVIGGFHLVRPRTDDEARRTVAEFAKMDPTYIIPMHCTGEVFIAEARRLLPEKVIRPYVGSQFVFEAG